MSAGLRGAHGLRGRARLAPAVSAQRIVAGQIVDRGVERIDVACWSFSSSSAIGALVSPPRRRRAHIDVVRHAQVLKHLLRHLGKHRRGDRGAVVRAALGIVDDHGHRDHRIVDRRNARERRNVHGLRIEMRGRIDLLRGAGFAAGGVAIELRRLAACRRAPRPPSSCASAQRSARRSRDARRAGSGLGSSPPGLNGSGCSCSLRVRFAPPAVPASAHAAAGRCLRWRLSKPSKPVAAALRATSWPMAIEPIDEAPHLLHWTQQAARFAGQFHARCALPNPNARM